MTGLDSKKYEWIPKITEQPWGYNRDADEILENEIAHFNKGRSKEGTVVIMKKDGLYKKYETINECALAIGVRPSGISENIMRKGYYLKNGILIYRDKDEEPKDLTEIKTQQKKCKIDFGNGKIFYYNSLKEAADAYNIKYKSFYYIMKKNKVFFDLELDFKATLEE